MDSYLRHMPQVAEQIAATWNKNHRLVREGKGELKLILGDSVTKAFFTDEEQQGAAYIAANALCGLFYLDDSCELQFEPKGLEEHHTEEATSQLLIGCCTALGVTQLTYGVGLGDLADGKPRNIITTSYMTNTLLPEANTLAVIATKDNGVFLVFFGKDDSFETASAAPAEA
jgi:hypothetical protein